MCIVQVHLFLQFVRKLHRLPQEYFSNENTNLYSYYVRMYLSKMLKIQRYTANKVLFIVIPINPDIHIPMTKVCKTKW